VNQAKQDQRSSIFAEALVTQQPVEENILNFHPWKRPGLNMANEGNFQKGLTPSGLSRN
jgi:hypothetical protein